MNNTPLPYPVPVLPDGVNVRGVHAHFEGLKADPPAQLLSTWYVIVYKRMAGINVDAECAELLHLERMHNAGLSMMKAEKADEAKPETAARKAFRTFKESQRGK